MKADGIFTGVFAPRDPTPEPIGYEPYRATRTLLEERAACFPGGPRALLAATGWNRTDAATVVSRWTSLRDGRIPRALLVALEVADAELNAALAHDLGQWEEASRAPVMVRGFIERLAPAIYIHVDLPQAMTLAAAIEHVQLVASQHGRPCVIGVGRVRTVGVEPDGFVWIVEHRPSVRVEGLWLVFEGVGPALGCTTSG
ncbi:MAG: hypothetical protein OHK0013_48940 [Sandaracinaceae bacterium]